MANVTSAAHHVCESVPTMSRNLDYDTPITVDTTQVGYCEQIVEPAHGLHNTPYEFTFEPMGDTFLNLSTLVMELTYNVTHENGTVLGKHDVVATVNNPLSSIWAEIETKINDIVINPDASRGIAYKSYIETLLSHSKFKGTYLEAAGFVKDTHTAMSDMRSKNAGGENLGFQTRAAQVAGSKEFTVVGAVPVEFLRSDNHLAPGNKLTLTFTPAANEFFLCADKDNFKPVYHIKSVKIRGRRLQMEQSLANELAPPNRPTHYLTSHTELHQHSLPFHLTSWNTSLTSDAVLPKQVVVGLVQTNAVYGQYKMNPFHFNSGGLNKIMLRKNGLNIPENGYQPTFADRLCRREYYELFLSTGKHHLGRGLPITFEEFLNGYSLFVFDLTPDKCNGRHTHGGLVGNLDLQLQWATPLGRLVNVQVMLVYDHLITIDAASGIPTSNIF